MPGRFSSLEFEEEGRDESACKEEARDDRYYFAHAEQALIKGDFRQALQYYSRSLQENVDLYPAWLGQVIVLVELGQNKEAQVWADKAMERYKDDPELLAAKAIACARTGDIKLALALSDGAISRRGETSSVWRARGDVLLACKDRTEDYCFLKAIQFSPKDYFLRVLIARGYMFYGKFAKALEHLETALQTCATNAFLWAQLSNCQMALGLEGKARFSLDKARELDPLLFKAGGTPVVPSHPSLISRIKAWLHRKGL